MEHECQTHGMTGTLQKCASQQLPKIQMLQNSTNIFQILKSKVLPIGNNAFFYYSYKENLITSEPVK